MKAEELIAKILENDPCWHEWGTLDKAKACDAIRAALPDIQREAYEAGYYQAGSTVDANNIPTMDDLFAAYLKETK